MASVAAITAALLGLTACSTINKVRNAVHDIRGNKATIDSFTTKLQSGAAVVISTDPPPPIPANPPRY